MLPDSIEEWLPIERSQGYFEVSNLGRVRRAVARNGSPVGRLLKSQVGTHGYPMVNMSCDGRKIVATIHTLVAEAFLGPKPGPAYQVNHLDGVKTHSYLSNLEWTTPQANTIHALRAGLLTPPSNDSKPRGERVHGAKLTARQVRAIRRVSREFSQTEVAEVLGISPGTVSLIRLGKTWKHIV